jgi:hypothetical protein
MTLDVLHFLDSKGGNAEEIRESQRKRGLAPEIVDEVVALYGAWVKRAPPLPSSLARALTPGFQSTLTRTR